MSRDFNPHEVAQWPEVRERWERFGQTAELDRLMQNLTHYKSVREAGGSYEDADQPCTGRCSTCPLGTVYPRWNGCAEVNRDSRAQLFTMLLCGGNQTTLFPEDAVKEVRT